MELCSTHKTREGRTYLDLDLARLELDETHVIKTHGMLIMVDVSCVDSVIYGFVSALAPKWPENEDGFVNCRLTITNDGSEVSCRGPAYSYEQWLDGFEGLVENGCAFAIAHEDQVS